MGRTNYKFHDRDDDDSRKSGKHYAKPPKHSRNLPGRGMRVINSWCEEEGDDLDDLDYEYSVDTTQTQR